MTAKQPRDSEIHPIIIHDAMIIGIDNGLSGGLVALSPVAGLPPIAKTAMPTRKAGDGHEVDVFALIQWIRCLKFAQLEPPAIFIEDCPNHSRGKHAMRSMAMTCGMIIGAITARFSGWRIERVASGNALAGWQRTILGRVPQGQTKEYALAAANQLWPHECWLATPRSTTPHDGIIDAALIAEFGRRKIAR